MFLACAPLDLPGNQTYNDGVIQTVIRAGGRGERLRPLTRRLPRQIPAGCVASPEQECFPQLITGHQLVAFATTRRFHDIGMPSQLKEIEAML